MNTTNSLIIWRLGQEIIFSPNYNRSVYANWLQIFLKTYFDLMSWWTFTVVLKHLCMTINPTSDILKQIYQSGVLTEAFC